MKRPPLFLRLRSRAHIQHAHDAIACLLDSPDLLELVMPEEEDRAKLSVALSTLCWTLGHDEAEEAENDFSKNLRLIEDRLRRLGIVFEALLLDASPANKAPDDPGPERTN